MNRLIFFLIVILSAPLSFAQPNMGVSGTVEWDTMLIKAAVSLDLSSAGVKIPSGRTLGESILSEGFLNLIRPGVMGIQVDSSSTIGDLVARGELSLSEADAIAIKARTAHPALSSDTKSMYSSHTIALSDISSALLNHNRPAPAPRTLNPRSSARYTGIIIIAPEKLPVHGRRSAALAIPCLFPKIWDSEMNLIYRRDMLETRDGPMVRYLSSGNIYQNNPSGLSPELEEIVGDRPLRVFARGVFGLRPTDLIIDRQDAEIIISSEENRHLLSRGRVAVILDDSVLRRDLGEE